VVVDVKNRAKQAKDPAGGVFVVMVMIAVVVMILMRLVVLGRVVWVAVMVVSFWRMGVRTLVVVRMLVVRFGVRAGFQGRVVRGPSIHIVLPALDPSMILHPDAIRTPLTPALSPLFTSSFSAAPVDECPVVADHDGCPSVQMSTPIEEGFRGEELSCRRHWFRAHAY